MISCIANLLIGEEWREKESRMLAFELSFLFENIRMQERTEGEARGGFLYSKSAYR